MPDPLQAVATASTETAPQQAAPPSAPEKPKRETKEEATGKAVNAARALFERFNGPTKKPKEEEPAEKPKEEQAKAPKEEEPQQEKKPEPPAEDVKVSKRKPKADKKDLVEALAEAQKPLVEAIQKQTKREESKVEEVPKPTLSKSDEKMVARLRKLEEINPNYKGSADNYLKFKEAERQYQSKWEAAHPDEEFDPSDDAHSKWYEKNEPSIDEDDFEEAKEALIREQAEKAAEERFRKELEPVKRKQAEESAIAKAALKIEKTLQTIGRNAAAAIDPKLGELKDLSKIGEEDPIAAEILTDTASRWMPIAQGASLLYSGHPADQNNPVFQAVGELVSTLETQISQLDEDMQVRNGKQFATIAEYAKMSPREQARHWYVGEDELVEFVDKRMAFEAKQRYDAEVKRAELLAQKRGYVPKSGQTPPQMQAARAEEQPRQQQSDQRSVRVGGSGAPPPAPATDSAASLSLKDKLAKRIGW